VQEGKFLAIDEKTIDWILSKIFFLILSKIIFNKENTKNYFSGTKASLFCLNKLISKAVYSLN